MIREEYIDAMSECRWCLPPNRFPQEVEVDDIVSLPACSGNHTGLISSIYHALPHQPDRCRLYEGPGPRLCYRVVGARASIQPSCFIQNVVRKNKAARVDGFGEDYYPFSMDSGASAARESSTPAPRARKG